MNENIYTSKIFESTPYSRLKVINIVPAPHASGKSYAMCHAIANSLIDEPNFKIALACPTYELMVQNRKTILAANKNLDHDDIHICVSPEAKNRKSRRHLESLLKDKNSSAIKDFDIAMAIIEERGRGIIIFTHQLHITSKDVRKQLNGFHVVYDEIPNFMTSTHHTFSKSSQEYLNKICTVVTSYNNLYAIRVNLHELGTDYKHDEMLRNLLPHIHNAETGSFLYVFKEQWIAMTGQRLPEDEDLKVKKINKMTIMSFTSPDIFAGTRSVTLLSADIKFHPVLNKIWTIHHGVNYKVNEGIMDQLRFKDFSETNIPNRLKLVYAFEDPYSKSCRLDETSNGKKKFQYLNDLINRKLKKTTKPCIVQNNDIKDTEDNYFNVYGHESGTDLSSYAHGMNCYIESTGIGFNLAINLNKPTQAILRQLDFDDLDLRFFHDSAYMQTIMRSNLRDLNSNQEVIVVAADYQSTLVPSRYFGVNCSHNVDHSHALRSTRNKVASISRSSLYSKKKLDQMQGNFFASSSIEPVLPKNFLDQSSDQDASSIHEELKACFDNGKIKVLYQRDDAIKPLELTPEELVKHLNGYCKHNNLDESFSIEKISGLYNGFYSYCTFQHKENSKTLDEALEIYKAEYGYRTYGFKQDDGGYVIHVLQNNPLSKKDGEYFQYHTRRVLEDEYGWKDHSIDTSGDDWISMPGYREGEEPKHIVKGFKTYSQLNNRDLGIDFSQLIEESDYITDKIWSEVEIEMSKEMAVERLTKQKEKKLKPINKIRSLMNVKTIDVNSEFADNLVKNDQINKDLRLFNKLMRQVEELSPGNRSKPSCQIAGAARFIEDPGLKRDLFYAMVNQGIDSSAQKSVIKYMRL